MRKRLLICICVAIAIFAISAMLFVHHASDIADRGRCSNNLRAVGQALLLYQNENHGAMPPDWGTLASTEDIAPFVFLCPGTKKTAPTFTDADQSAAWVNANSDYVYLGAISHSTSNPQIVIAYDKPENHDGDGINILFQDGQTAFFGKDEATKIIAQLNANINPPKFESKGVHLGSK